MLEYSFLIFPKTEEKSLDYFLKLCYNIICCKIQYIFALIAQLDRASAF